MQNQMMLLKYMHKCSNSIYIFGKVKLYIDSENLSHRLQEECLMVSYQNMSHFYSHTGSDVCSICDPILENLPFGHKGKLWKNSIENLSIFFKN